MEKEDQTFQERKVLSAIRIEKGGDQTDGNGEKSALPASGVVVGVVQNNQSLNHGAGQECGACSAGLPSESANPADDVAKVLLHALGCKLRDPVVLATRGWSHGRHVGHGCYDAGEHDDDADIGPDETPKTAVDEAVGACCKHGLPRAHQSTGKTKN